MAKGGPPNGKEIKGTQNIWSSLCLLVSRHFFFTTIKNMKLRPSLGSSVMPHWLLSLESSASPASSSSDKGKVPSAHPGLQRPPDVCSALSPLRIRCFPEDESRNSQTRPFSSAVCCHDQPKPSSCLLFLLVKLKGLLLSAPYPIWGHSLPALFSQVCATSVSFSCRQHVLNSCADCSLHNPMGHRSQRQ